MNQFQEFVKQITNHNQCTRLKTPDGSFTLWIFTVMDIIVFESFRNFMSYVTFYDFLMFVILV